MATRKRRSTKRRRVHARRANPVNPVNPVRRRRRSTKRRRSTVYARRRNPVNPVRHRRRHHRRHHRRRNPIGGLFSRAVPLVLGSAAIGMAAPFTAQLVGRFAPQLLGTPIGAAGTTFATGWGLSALARMFSFTRRWADDVLLAGAILAGGQLFSAYVAPMIPRIGGGGNPTGMGRRFGMRGIAAVHGVPPQISPPPAPQNNGMQGVAALPGGWAR